VIGENTPLFVRVGNRLVSVWPGRLYRG